ncbi:MAG: ADP-forming succinate--CoA ligase subunit beta [Candidatus Cloacimonadota bacterium]|nr:MAG: ADP-forming succinate--CoA ligase subunit beta [Candidatus Cloacimonadota bacterium]
MKIHEYQAKEILKEYGIQIPVGFVTDKVSEVKKLVKKLPTKLSVIKAQIHAGGRGKGGGVKLAKTVQEAEIHAKAILGMQLVTHQTGPEGQKVKKLLIEQGMDIEHEYYLGVTLDRGTGKITMIGSTEGGMDIEKVSAETPEKIIKVRVDPANGLTACNIRKLIAGMGFTDKALQKKFTEFCKALYNVYLDKDCSLIEINPLVVTKQEDMYALDCKINIDDSAFYRQKDIMKYHDEDEEEPLELEAQKYGLNYIKLDGNVGCMVNGAGLAMGTMDIIKAYGGSPANFLDVGGTADATRVANAFKIFQKDKNVKAILINIFGGIVRCDRVAQGVVDAMKTSKLDLPLVVRLAGTNAIEAKQLLEDSGVSVIAASNLEDAAKKVCETVK